MNRDLDKELKDVEYIINKLTQKRLALLALISHKPKN